MREKIYEDLLVARKEQNKARVAILTMLWSRILLKDKESLKVLTDDDIIAIIKNELKQTKETLEGFQKRGDEDQIRLQEFYISVLESYLPKQLTEEEIREKVIALTSIAPDVSDFGSFGNAGAVMKYVMPHFKGIADGKLVKQVVEGMFKK